MKDAFARIGCVLLCGGRRRGPTPSLPGDMAVVLRGPPKPLFILSWRRRVSLTC